MFWFPRRFLVFGMLIGLLVFTSPTLRADARDDETLVWDAATGLMASKVENDLLPARALPTEADTQEVNLRYRLGYWRGFYGGGYILPRTYAWRLGYWHGYYGYYPSYARYWSYYPVYPYRSWTITTHYSVPACYYSVPVVYYDPCTIPIGLTTSERAVPSSPSTIETSPATPRKDSQATPPSESPMPLPPQPGEPAPKPNKPGVEKLNGELRLVHETHSGKRYRYPAYGEHLRPETAPRGSVTRLSR